MAANQVVGGLNCSSRGLLLPFQGFNDDRFPAIDALCDTRIRVAKTFRGFQKRIAIGRYLGAQITFLKAVSDLGVGHYLVHESLPE